MANGNIRPHERFVFGIVALGGILALFFGFLYMKESIVSPHRLKERTFKTPSEQATEAEILLRTKDTDQDGLNDYEEINVWQTSAYIADTDSDGLSDKQEIDAGDNPNCPKNKECPGFAALPVPAPQPAELLPPETQALLGEGNSGLAQVLASLPPEEIRKLLIEQGIPEETLKNLPDEVLVELFKSSVSEAMKKLREQGEAGL